MEKRCLYCNKVIPKTMLTRTSVYKNREYCGIGCSSKHNSIIQKISYKTIYNYAEIKAMLLDGLTEEDIINKGNNEEKLVQSLDSDKDSLFYK